MKTTEKKIGEKPDGGSRRGHGGGHTPAGGHTHSHSPADMGGLLAGDNKYLLRAFTIGIVLNLIFVFVEFAAGFLLDSVALMSDAGHNLSDVVSLALALMAFRLAGRKPTPRYTYGHKKSTILASLANACLLLIAIGVILVESIGKLIDPQPVQGGAIAWVAGVGIIINGFTAWLFIRHKNKDLNVKGAYLHMLADTLVSVGVLVSGVVISFTGWYIIDPLIGIAIVIVIFFTTWNLLRDSIRLSLDGVPPGIDVDDLVERMMAADERIKAVHHVHVWAISTTENALTAHIVMDCMDDVAEVMHNVKCSLRLCGIGHVTLEAERPGCGTEEGCPQCD